MKEDEAAKLIYMAVAAFPHLQNRDVRWTDTIKIWAMVMGDDVEYHYAEQALIEILRESSFFPSAGEVRRAARVKQLEAEAGKRELENDIERQVEDAWYRANKEEIDASVVKTIEAFRNRRRVIEG